jgi:glycosyltransferase involved in cell wall biosynthesis
VSKIKVLRIINRFSLGGPSFHVILLTKYLNSTYETALVGGVPEPGEADSYYLLEKYDLEATILPELRRDLNFLSDIRAYFKLKKIIEDYKPDIVHTHASKAGALGRLAAHHCGVKIIIHTYHGHVFHSYFGKIKTTFYKIVERYLAKITTGIIAISETQKYELSEIFKIAPKDKIEVIPLGLDLSAFVEKSNESRLKARKKLSLSSDEVAIGIIGRLAPIKDHHFFLDAIELVLSKTKIKIRVFIVGDGTEKFSIQERVNEINSKYPGKIKMTSWIREMVPIYHALDLVCLSSKNEGTPVSLIEAQAAGLPVLSNDVGGVRDIVKNGKSGYIVPKNNLQAYTEKLLELIESPELRTQMGGCQKDEILKRYQYQRLVDDMRQYYNKLIAQS